MFLHCCCFWRVFVCLYCSSSRVCCLLDFVVRAPFSRLEHPRRRRWCCYSHLIGANSSTAYGTADPATDGRLGAERGNSRARGGHTPAGGSYPAWGSGVYWKCTKCSARGKGARFRLGDDGAVLTPRHKGCGWKHPTDPGRDIPIPNVKIKTAGAAAKAASRARGTK